MEKSDKLPFTITTSKGSKSVNIALSGNLTLDGIDALKLMLTQNLDRYQEFNLKLEDVENIDLGMIQLLYSFKLSAEKKSKSVSMEFYLNSEHKQLLEHGGFAELINAKQ